MATDPCTDDWKLDSAVSFGEEGKCKNSTALDVETFVEKQGISGGGGGGGASIFLGGKTHGVRLRGVETKIQPVWAEKDGLKNRFVLTRTVKPWLAICCCCRLHATAPTHRISGPWWWLALVVLVRGELSDFLNPKLPGESALAVFSK